jgi:hypothetical protein
MITTGTKWFFGLGFVTLVLAWAYGWTTGGSGLGPITVGYKGGVGDHFGYAVLLGAAVVSIVLGVVSTGLRDADPEAEAQVAGTDVVPPVTPVATSYWPVIAAFGVALTIVGLVTEAAVFVFGLITVGIALIEWTVQAWADRATGDPAANREIRNRLMNPVEFPAAGLLAIALVVVAFSRVFLAVSSESAVWVATGLAAVIFLVGALAASRPKLGSNLVVGLLLVGAVGVLAAGVVAAVAGEREFHEHESEEHTDYSDDVADEEALPIVATTAPVAPATPVGAVAPVAPTDPAVPTTAAPAPGVPTTAAPAPSLPAPTSPTSPTPVAP